MYLIALKMLLGDRGKYLSLVFGLSFAVLLITQQGSIFLGLMLRATGFLQNVTEADLWVADPSIRYIAEYRSLPEGTVERVRGVPGVEWAEPFFAARAQMEMPDGRLHTVQLLGVDRSTLVGRPPEMVAGDIQALRAPDAVLVEASSVEKLGEPLEIGDVVRLNDHRAKVVGFCRAKLGFESNILMYTTYENAVRFVPLGRNDLSFVLVKIKEGWTADQVREQIEVRVEDVGAFTREELTWRTIWFILNETGIGINFGITVLLGFIVGLVVSAATFYQFTVENLRHFAVLKAMGARTRTLVRMILLQALVVGLISYGIGVGLAGAFSLPGRRPGAELAAHFPWQLMVGALVAMLLCVSLGSLLSLRRVIRLEPAVVFK